ncbi:MAG: L-seryl-tRNA(Sec) selenium transferase [Anaerolineae bacterium]|nr:L-seryl-tRNA(Sec) selenium transferase [Anaerolineae bacterium]
MNGSTATALRQLPSVDRLLQTPDVAALVAAHGRAVVTEAVRAALDEARASIRAGGEAPEYSALVQAVEAVARTRTAPTLIPVINATGVIIHTNLGRAPLSRAARQAILDVALGYSNLEYDLAQGQRGSRYAHAAALLAELTGAEAGLVVNNNAAAVTLILAALCADREVLISRGELVEIGGGFRIPDVLRQSGARLVEVGTTNRTYARDFEAAITPYTAAILTVHASNFRIVGFTHTPARDELAALAHERGLWLIDDIGSGALLDTTAYSLAPEPMPQASLQAGADLVAFSGDKLLGGPQAGLIVGRTELIELLRRFPLTRALRVDKLTLAALHATLLHYRRGEIDQIPVWAMVGASLDDLRARAETWEAALAGRGVAASVVSVESTVGGGSLPGETLPSVALALSVPSPDTLAARLRTGALPVVARIEAGRLLLDPRTVLPEQDDALLAALLAQV